MVVLGHHVVVAVDGRSKPKRGTSIGVELSLCVDEPGGTCSLSSLACRHLYPPGSENLGLFSVSLPPHPENLNLARIDMGPLLSNAHQIAPGIPPARRDLTSDTRSPPPPDSIEKRFAPLPTLSHYACHSSHP
jgi:hypothetical protein